MATQNILLAKRRAGNWITGFAHTFTRTTIQALFSWFSQFGGNPDLAVVEFDKLTNTDVIISGAACTLYALVLQKTTATLAYFKGTNNATTCSTDGTQNITIPLNAIGDAVFMWPKGYALSTGLTVQGNTTPTGSTGSGANGPRGFAIIG